MPNWPLPASIPEASADSDVLFKYARWLQKNNLLKQDKAADAQIERLYRIAASNGHVKASIKLQNGAIRGQFNLRSDERLRMSQKLIEAKVATGYYFIAIYLERCAARLQQNPDRALRYYRKAADEGNSQAQAYVGHRLAPAKMSPEIARQMRRCAAEQGNSEAAQALGNEPQIDGLYKEAMEAFQLGVAAGNESASSFLEHGFDDFEPTNGLYYLGQKKDLERVRRYKAIWKVLSSASYASPKVPEINDIVPLPAVRCPLSAWDGKLKWVESRKANVPPTKSGEALIEQLAKDKQLNPETGRPLFDKSAAVHLLCKTGEPSPKSGYWRHINLTRS